VVGDCGRRGIDANDPLQTSALVAAWACAKNFDKILSSFFDQLHLPDWGAALVIKTYWAYAIILCCLGSAAQSAGIRDNLAAIKIPLQFWRSEQGGGGVDSAGTARLAANLPGRPDIHVMPAGHFGFLPPCSPQFAANLPRFCTDPSGFDRTAFHRDFDASIVRFFQKRLVSDGGTL
jgi:hypothetical protein